jgi:hypothetical protein
MAVFELANSTAFRHNPRPTTRFQAQQERTAAVMTLMYCYGLKEAEVRILI